MNAGSLSYTRRGRGEPLLVLHGIGSRWQVWQPVLPDVAEHRDVVAVDLPGFGGSPSGDTTATVADYADRMVTFCAELGVERPHVAGHSLGGAVALELGRRGFARSVVAFAPIGFWGASGTLWCQTALGLTRAAAPWARPILPLLARSAAGRAVAAGLFYGKPSRLAGRHVVEDADALRGAPMFRSACRAFGDHVFTETGGLDRIPVTVAWGTRDLLLTYRSQAPRARQALPRARHVRLGGCGHVPFTDDPVSCRMLLLDQW